VRKRASGQALVEAAITVTLLVFSVLAVFDFAQGFWTWQALDAAANEGTRWAIVHGSDANVTMDAAAQQIEPYLRTRFGAGIPAATNVKIEWPEGANGPGNPVRVSLDVKFLPASPWLQQKKDVTLRATSEMGIIQ
jgi:Flp pilus assembly protein TadG